MIPFRKITLADAPTIASFFEGDERERAIKAIKRFAKSGDSDLCMAIVDGMLVFRQEASQLYVYSMPVGHGNLRLVLMQMMQAADLMGYDWLIVGIRQEEQELLRAALPQHFKFSGEEKFSYLDMLNFGRSIVDTNTYVAVPVQDYSGSIFHNHRRRVRADLIAPSPVALCCNSAAAKISKQRHTSGLDDEKQRRPTTMVSRLNCRQVLS